MSTLYREKLTQMFKKIYLKPALLTILALGVALKITNPSEEKHKETFYTNLEKTGTLSSQSTRLIGKSSDWLSNVFGTKSVFIYKNNFFYSSLKIDNNNNGIADSGDTTVTFGILGNVFGGRGK